MRTKMTEDEGCAYNPDDDSVSPAAASLATAKYEADIDGYGDEGAGYDYEYMAEWLFEHGWTYTEPEA